MWDLIVSVPDHCLSFYLALQALTKFVSIESLSCIMSWSVIS